VTQLGIVAALPAEVKCLAGWPDQYQHMPDTSSPLPSEQAKKPLLSISGIGPEAARTAAAMLVKHGATALLSWGCAGALSKELVPGNLLLPLTILTEDGQTLYTHDTWRKQLMDQISGTRTWQEGMLVESNRVVSTLEDKKKLARRSNAIAVDMESAAIGRVADQAGIPFMAIRAVADTADEAIPPCVARAMDSKGHLRMQRLLPTLLHQPLLWPKLLRMGRHFHAATYTLRVVSGQTDLLFHIV